MNIYYISCQNKTVVQLYDNGNLYKYSLDAEGLKNGQVIIQTLKQKIINVFFNGERQLHNYLFTDQYMQAVLKYQSEQLISSNTKQNLNIDSLWQQLQNTFYFPMKNTRPIRACQGRQSVNNAFGQYVTAKQFYGSGQQPRGAQQSKGNNPYSTNEYMTLYQNIEELQNINFHKQKQFTVTEIEFPNLIQERSKEYLMYSQFKQLGKQNTLKNYSLSGNKQVKEQYKQVVQYPSSYTLCRYYPLIFNSGEVIFAKHCFGSIYGPSVHIEPDGKIWHIGENVQDGYTVQEKNSITYTIPHNNLKLKYYDDGTIESLGQLKYSYTKNMFDLKLPIHKSCIFDNDNHIEIVYFNDVFHDLFRECLDIYNSNINYVSEELSMEFDIEIDAVEDVAKQYNAMYQKDKQLYYTKQLSTNQLQSLKKSVSDIFIPKIQQQQLENRESRIQEAKSVLKQIVNPQRNFINTYSAVQCEFKPLTNICSLVLNNQPNTQSFHTNLNLAEAQRLAAQNTILMTNGQSDNTYAQDEQKDEINIQQSTDQHVPFQYKIVDGQRNNEDIFKYDVLFSHLRNKTSLIFQSQDKCITKQFLFCLRYEKYSKGIIIQYYPRSQEKNSIINQLKDKLNDQDNDTEFLDTILIYLEMMYYQKINAVDHDGIKWKNLQCTIQQYKINPDQQISPLTVFEDKDYKELLAYFSNMLDITDDITINYGIFDNQYIDFLKYRQASSFTNTQYEQQNDSSIDPFDYAAQQNEEKANKQQKVFIPQFYKTNNDIYDDIKYYKERNNQSILQSTLISLRNNMIQIICLNEYTMGKNCAIMHDDYILLLNLNRENEIISPFCILSTEKSLKRDSLFQDIITKLQQSGSQSQLQLEAVNKKYIHETITSKQQQYSHYFPITQDHLLFSLLVIDNWLSEQRLISENITSYTFNINYNQTNIQLIINPLLSKSMECLPTRVLNKFNQVVQKLILLRTKICFQNISSSNDVFYELQRFMSKDKQAQSSILTAKLQKGKSQKPRIQQKTGPDGSTQKVDMTAAFMSVAFNQLFIFLLQIYADINVSELVSCLGFQLFVNDKQCISYEVLHQLDHFITRMIYLGIQ